jgi:hypothetical protein
MQYSGSSPAVDSTYQASYWRGYIGRVHSPFTIVSGEDQRAVSCLFNGAFGGLDYTPPRYAGKSKSKKLPKYDSHYRVLNWIYTNVFCKKGSWIYTPKENARLSNAKNF